TNCSRLPREVAASGVLFMAVTVPAESMALDVGAAKEKIVGQLRKSPKVSSPEDLQSYVGSPVPVLGLTLPSMRAIVVAFAKDHKRLTAAELNALASALWSPHVRREVDYNSPPGPVQKILDDASWRVA